MYLQYTGPGYHPLPPVSPPPTTPPSNPDEFSHPNSLIPEGQVTGFGCNVALDVVPDSKEEDIPPPLENVDPIPIVVGHSVFRSEVRGD